MSLWNDFPAMEAETLRQLKRAVDSGFREFTRDSGAGIEQFFAPLGDFLLFCERLLTQSPWPVVMAAVLALIWLSSRSRRIVVSGNCPASLPTSRFRRDRIAADWPRSVASTALG